MYKSLTINDGRKFKEGDFVKCYWAGYYTIKGFKDYSGIDKRNIPQVYLVQQYDSRGNRKTSKIKSCIAESLELVTMESITKETQQVIDEAIKQQQKLKAMMEKH